MIEDMEIYQESLEEISELTDQVINDFIKISEAANPDEVSDKMYDPLMRNIHSIKGALGMIGLTHQMTSVHSAESFLIDTYKKVKFTPGVLDLMIDFWSKFQTSLGDVYNPTLDVAHFSECYNCLKRSEFKSVCKNHFSGGSKCSELVQNVPEQTEELPRPSLRIQITADEVEKSIIVIGADDFVSRTLSKHQKDYHSYGCINEIYRKMSLAKLKGIKTIFLDLSNLNTNPFLLLSVLKQLKLSIKCCYIISDKNDLTQHLEDIHQLYSFCVISKQSPYFEAEILTLAG